MFYNFMDKCTEIYVEKMRERLLTFFQKNFDISEILTFEILTKR